MNAKQPSGPPPKPDDALSSLVPATPWARASQSKRARKSEEQAAKLEGGRRVPMSGAGRQKGDVKAGLFLIQDKYTDASSYTLTEKELDKAAAEAVIEHRLWQFRISLPHYRLRVLREEDYLWLQAMAAGDSE